MVEDPEDADAHRLPAPVLLLVATPLVLLPPRHLLTPPAIHDHPGSQRLFADKSSNAHHQQRTALHARSLAFLAGEIERQ